MNNLQSNDLNIIVNIQYGIGFQLVEGKVEIEITFFNRVHRSKIVSASRNRINFYEEFLWKIDKNTLKYCKTTNEMVKLECFKIPYICYENTIYRRQRIGHTMIKLNEFQFIGRDWDQNGISPRSYKLFGSSNNYEFLIILTIQDRIDSDNSRNIKKRLGYDLNYEFKIGELKNYHGIKSKTKYSSSSICNSSSQTENNLKQQNEEQNVILRDIISKLNELTEFINEVIKNNKNNY